MPDSWGESHGFFFFFFFLLFRATAVAHGISQVRGLIRAVVAGLYHSHSNAGSKPHLRRTPHSEQCQILNPLSEARDRTYVLMDTS